MNKIVRKHYPVDHLPADLQVGLPEHGLVTIELEPEPGQAERQSIAHLVGSGPNLHGNDREVLDYIANLRADR
jgi:hypothetical protein